MMDNEEVVVNKAMLAAAIDALKGQLGRLRKEVGVTEKQVKRFEKLVAGLPGKERHVAGVPLSEFTGRPYYRVGEGCLYDNADGRLLKRGILGGAMRAVVAHLIAEGQIHDLEIACLRAKKPYEDIKSCRRLTDSAIANLNRCADDPGFLVRRKDDDCHSPLRELCRDPGLNVLFSVDLAVWVAGEAEKAFEAGDFRTAASLSMEAIAVEELVQLPHELLCRAVNKISVGEFEDEDRLRESVLFLRRRIRGNQIAVQIVDNTPADTLQDPKWEYLPAMRTKMDRDAHRLGLIIKPIQDYWAQRGDSVEEDEVSGLIDELREKPIPVNAARHDSRMERVLNCNAVCKLYKRIHARFGMEKDSVCICGDWVNVKDMLIERILDKGHEANIRAICETIKYMLLSDGDGKTPPPPPTNVCKWLACRERLTKEFGRPPTDEEVAEKLGYSPKQRRAVLDWLKAHRVGGSNVLDSFGQRDDDDDEDGDGDHHPADDG